MAGQIRKSCNFSLCVWNRFSISISKILLTYVVFHIRLLVVYSFHLIHCKLKDGSDYFRIWGFYAKKPQNALGSLLVVINAWELVRLTIQIMKKLFKIYPTVIKHTENFLETLKIGNFFVFRDLSLILKEKRSVSYKLL